MTYSITVELRANAIYVEGLNNICILNHLFKMSRIDLRIIYFFLKYDKYIFIG